MKNRDRKRKGLHVVLSYNKMCTIDCIEAHVEHMAGRINAVTAIICIDLFTGRPQQYWVASIKRSEIMSCFSNHIAMAAMFINWGTCRFVI